MEKLGKKNRWKEECEEVTVSLRGDKSKVQFNILESPSFSRLFNVLMRRGNAAFISPANSSVIREEEQWWEWKKRQRAGRRGGKIGMGGGVVEVLCSIRIKQTDLIPFGRKKRQIKKSDGQHQFFFFFFHSQSAAWEATWDVHLRVYYVLSIYLLFTFVFPPVL